MVNFRLLAAEIGLPVWGTPANFNGFRVLASLLNGRQPTFVRCLTVSWAGTLYLHFLRPKGILPGAKFTLGPSLALSCVGSVTARHWNSGREPNFAAWYKE